MTSESERRKHSSPGLAFGRAQLLIFNEVVAGRSAQLHTLYPEIVYLLLAPFVGHDEAIRESRIAQLRSGTDATAASDR